jgi:hypothetical protein
MERMPKMITQVLFAGTMGLYTLYSYSQVDPNLILSDNVYFWQFQQFLWQLGYHNRGWSAFLYTLIMFILFYCYREIASRFYTNQWTMRDFKRLLIIVVLTLLPAYPALSHDVFNYAMNAKIVWKYQADPHAQVALDFPNDPWLTFMHNVHTPAPYAKGWTAFSLPFGFIGQENIKLTMFIFRIVNVIAFGGLLYVLYKLPLPKRLGSLALLAFNPLMLIESIGNIHNDVIMMALALAGYYAISTGYVKKRWWLLFIGIVVLLISISIKYASIMIVAGLFVFQGFKRLRLHLSKGAALAISHFSLLLSERSKWFLPWYLIWSLSFLPLVKEPLLVSSLIFFSLSGLLSYVPYLYWGQYFPTQDWQRMAILWGLPLLLILILNLRRKRSIL